MSKLIINASSNGQDLDLCKEILLVNSNSNQIIAWGKEVNIKKSLSIDPIKS